MKLDEIKAIYDKNAIVLEQCARLLNYMPDIMTRETINEITGGNKSLEQISFANFISNVFFENEYEANEYFKEYYVKSLKKLNPESYYKNPYFKNIKIQSKVEGGWTLGMQSYAPYELFVYDDLLIEDYHEIPRLGFFEDEFSFPTVYEDGIEWMAIKPNEIETMREPIEKAHGKVCVYGLGLGYYAYMISLKKNVSSVTVIERDENVIKLFENNILPQFENKHKIKIIKSDAFSYLENEASRESYNFTFVDLWHDISDGIDLYIQARKLESKQPETEFSYWIELSIISHIRKSIFETIYEKIKTGQLEKTDNELETILKDSYIKELILHL